MPKARPLKLSELLLLGGLFAACGQAGPAHPTPGAPLTVDGTVVGVDNRSPSEQLAGGLRITLQPEGRPSLLVQLAPGWYLDAHGLRFSEQDRIRVEGTARAGTRCSSQRA